ncbi:unnamed protein product, partial [Effrenium voratum]
MVYGRIWPANCAEVINYLQARGDEPCGASVPQNFLAALTLLEEIGRGTGRTLHATPIIEWTVGQAAWGQAGGRRAARFLDRAQEQVAKSVCAGDPPYSEEGLLEAFGEFATAREVCEQLNEEEETITPLDKPEASDGTQTREPLFW